MKAIGIIIGIIILIVIGAFVYLAQNLDGLVKNAIERFGPEYLGVSVRVDDVNLSLTEGTGSITGLQIGNPSGYEGPYAMRIARIALALDTSTVTSDPVVIDSVLVDGADMAVAVKGVGDSNLTAIMKHLNAQSGDAPEDATASETEAGPKVIIEKFEFTNAETSVTSQLLAESVAVDVPDVRLNGIGRKGDGTTAQEAAVQILDPIFRSAMKAVAAEGIGFDKEGLTDKAKDAMDQGIKKLQLLGHPDD